MARKRATLRCVVRVDPDIYSDAAFADSLTLGARAAYVDSLFYLATAGEPDGYYPHAVHAEQAGGLANAEAQQLVSFGIWRPVALGYEVVSYSGWRVLREYRAVIGPTTRQAVYERDSYRCVTCGTDAALSVDHIQPWSLGGSDDLDNLQTMCRPCNSRKGARV